MHLAQRHHHAAKMCCAQKRICSFKSASAALLEVSKSGLQGKTNFTSSTRPKNYSSSERDFLQQIDQQFSRVVNAFVLRTAKFVPSRPTQKSAHELNAQSSNSGEQDTRVDLSDPQFLSAHLNSETQGTLRMRDSHTECTARRRLPNPSWVCAVRLDVCTCTRDTRLISSFVFAEGAAEQVTQKRRRNFLAVTRCSENGIRS